MKMLDRERTELSNTIAKEKVNELMKNSIVTVLFNHFVVRGSEL